MNKIDLSQLDFSTLVFPRITKVFKETVQLYCDCKYDEAELCAKKLKGYEPQLADMRAQTAFFRCDFNECVQQAILFYPFLDEWYSGNKRWETEKMLEYALQKADEEIRREAIEILMSMYHYFSDEQLERRGFEHFKHIPRLIEHAAGNLESVSNPYHIYSPPESPKELSEITDEYLTFHKKRLSKLQGDPLENPGVISHILLMIKDQGHPEDYIELYSKHFSAPQLLNDHFDAAKIYIYLKQEDKARESLINFARYGFIPIEWTDVKPMSIFVDYSFVPLFNKELFDIIYHLPVPQLKF